MTIEPKLTGWDIMFLIAVYAHLTGHEVSWFWFVFPIFMSFVVVILEKLS